MPQASQKGKRVGVVVPERSYNLPLGLIGGSALAYFVADNVAVSVVLGLIGLLLSVSATRVKLSLTDTSIVFSTQDDQQFRNVLSGEPGNSWKYDAIVSWEYWWPGFPVLFYFKEIQSKADGQIHFFPVLYDGKKIYDTMAERCGLSKRGGQKNK